jgi:phosphosulfolactate phosphohydrolase-like enzyme
MVCAMIDAKYGDDLAALFAESEHGRALAAAGFEKDLEICATIDAFPVVPLYQDRQITALGPRLER